MMLIFVCNELWAVSVTEPVEVPGHAFDKLRHQLFLARHFHLQCVRDWSGILCERDED